MPITAYKAAFSGEPRVLITLEIPDDAVTNMGRKDIVNKQTAKHRTNKAIVRQITDALGNKYEVAYSINNKKLTYKLGEVIEEPEFNMDMEEVCASGIHFFLEKECAELYYTYSLKDDIWKSWYDNGQLYRETRYNNEEDKLKVWYKNGNLEYEYNYKIEKENRWYEDSNPMYEYNYKNGEKNGVQREWYKNGQMFCEHNYENGEQIGLQIEWYYDGNIRYIIQKGLSDNGDLINEFIHVDRIRC